MNEPTQGPGGLHFSLLDEPLIRYRRRADGEPRQASLPDLFVAMRHDEVRDFPALRPHQRHPWHAFLVQLAAIALHRAGQTEPWPTAQAWRHALLALTPDDPDGAAWCLVSPPDRPALLQAPVPGGQTQGWKLGARTPDELDMLITSKNHDLKGSRATHAQPDDWLFSLLSLQTQEGSNSGSYKGISRMNSGAGSRPGVGISTLSGFGRRWRRDVGLLLKNREGMADTYGFIDDGVELTWLHPWDGLSQIDFQRLGAFYIEICRRVRLIFRGKTVCAQTEKTPVSRIFESKDRKGRTGDPWVPINLVEGKILTLYGERGFDYELVAKLLSGQDYERALMQGVNDWGDEESLYFLAQCVARGNSKTIGFHERKVPVSKKFRRLLGASDKSDLSRRIKRRVDAVGGVSRILCGAYCFLLEKGGKAVTGNPARKHLTQRVQDGFEKYEDARFFADLIFEIESEDSSQKYIEWQSEMTERAEDFLRNAFDAGPRSAMQRYRAQAAALSHFHSELRGPKSPVPDLAEHWRQQATQRAALHDLSTESPEPTAEEPYGSPA